jgi:hypothetical protein
VKKYYTYHWWIDALVENTAVQRCGGSPCPVPIALNRAGVVGSATWALESHPRSTGVAEILAEINTRRQLSLLQLFMSPNGRPARRIIIVFTCNEGHAWLH